MVVICAVVLAGTALPMLMSSDLPMLMSSDTADPVDSAASAEVAQFAAAEEAVTRVEAASVAVEVEAASGAVEVKAALKTTSTQQLPALPVTIPSPSPPPPSPHKPPPLSPKPLDACAAEGYIGPAAHTEVDTSGSANLDHLDASPLDCCVACTSHASGACRGFVIYRGTCYLKSGELTPRRKEGRTAYYHMSRRRRRRG